MTRKNESNIRNMHSRRTGAIILIALTIFLVGSAILFYLSWEEMKLIQANEDRFRMLSCEDMVSEMSDPNVTIEQWQRITYVDKGCMEK